MVTGYNIGRMEGTKDIGKMIRRAAKENFNILKVTSIVENGLMTSYMGKELIFLMMVQNLKDNGQIIIRMDMVKKLHQITRFIQANSLMERSMEKAIKYLQTKQNI